MSGHSDPPILLVLVVVLGCFSGAWRINKEWRGQSARNLLVPGIPDTAENDDDDDEWEKPLALAMRLVLTFGIKVTYSLRLREQAFDGVRRVSLTTDN